MKKNIIASFLKFAVYINNHKMLSGNIFGLILRNKMAATGVFLSVMKSAYISLIFFFFYIYIFLFFKNIIQEMHTCTT